jgi:hypothetical protein
MGWTKVSNRANASPHRHGGVSHLRTARRSVVLHGPLTSQKILAGFKDFLTELYQRPMGLSSLLVRAGLNRQEVQSLNNSNGLNSLVMDFCPAFHNWIIETLDHTSSYLLIDFYGLYGDAKVSMNQLVRNLDLKDEAHGHNRLHWILRQLRTPERLQQLELVALTIAKAIIR